MQRLPRFSKICNLFTDFGPILAWVLLRFFKDFITADKTAMCKSAFTHQADLQKFHLESHHTPVAYQEK